MFDATRPLAGIKVVEFSTMITASLAAMMFAQQGAEVIKVEPPQIGDPMRWLGSQKAGISGLFHNCNRAKRSIVLDLKSDAGRSAARALCLDADIVIHNYRPGVMTRLGLDSASLRGAKPSLIYCAITGFGRSGPMAERPAYDHVMQAMCGLMNVQGGNDAPAFVRTLICDKVTAYTAAQAITAALFHRERSGGEGQHIDLSMLASCLAFLWPDGAMHVTLRGDDVTPGPPFRQFYSQPIRTSDGAVASAGMSDAHWAVIFDAVGRPELKADPRFAGMAGRVVHADALAAELAATPVTWTTEELLANLAAGDVPAAPCVAIEALPDHTQIIAIEAMEDAAHPLLGPVRNVRHAPRFAGRANQCTAPSPALGQHSEEILADLRERHLL